MKKIVIITTLFCGCYLYAMEVQQNEILEVAQHKRQRKSFSEYLPLRQPGRLDDKAAKVAFKFIAQQVHPRDLLCTLPNDLVKKYINKAVDCAGRSALYYATTKEQITELLDAGLDILMVDRVEQDSALSYALKHGSIPSVLVLAKIRCKNYHGMKDWFCNYTFEKIAGKVIKSDMIEIELMQEGFGSPERMSRNQLFCIEHVEEVQKLLHDGCTINQQDIWGNSPCIFALKNLRPDIASALMQCGADVTLNDSLGRSALSYSIILHYNDFIPLLVSKCFTMQPDCENCTLLDLAARYNIYALPVLLDEYFDNHHYMSYEEDHTKKDLTMVLKTAARYNEAAIDILVAAGAEINGTHNVRMKRELRTNPNNQDDEGSTLLMGSTPLMVTVRRNPNPATVCRLIDCGADPNLVGKKGKTALYVAVLYENNNVLETLIRFGANINFNSGKSILHIAGEHNFEAFPYLLDAYGQTLDLNIRDWDGNTPLMSLVRELGFDCPDFVLRFETLVSHGARLDIKNNGGKTIMHLLAARCIEGFSCEEFDEEYTLTAIHCLKLLFNMQMNCNMQDESGDTPLMSLFHYSKFLLARLNLAKKYIEHIITLIELFLNAGADCELTDKDGNSLLHKAVEFGQPKIIKYLIAKNLKLLNANKNGNTPLQLAEEYLQKAHNSDQEFNNTGAVKERMIKKYQKIIKILSID